MDAHTGITVYDIKNGSTGPLVSLTVDRDEVVIEWVEILQSGIIQRRAEYRYNPREPFFKILQNGQAHYY